MNRTTTLLLILSITGLIAAAGGCITRPQHPAATQPATAVDPATTQPGYWLDLPAADTVRADDFERLMRAAEDTARDYRFRIDRIDYRSGLLTTEPLVSKQWFEFWRNDVQDWDDLAESSLATMRRTVRFEFDRLDDGTFQVTPKVLVERQTFAEQRVTSAAAYRMVFRRPLQPHRRQRGTPELDIGVYIPDRYWTPTGRDPALERALADSIQRKLPRAGQRVTAAESSTAELRR